MQCACGWCEDCGPKRKQCSLCRQWVPTHEFGTDDLCDVCDGLCDTAVEAGQDYADWIADHEPEALRTRDVRFNPLDIPGVYNRHDDWIDERMAAILTERAADAAAERWYALKAAA